MFTDNFSMLTYVFVYQVSTKALWLLAQVEQEPLLNIEQLNPELVKHAQPMAQANRLRERLRLMGDYLLTCRSGACKKLQARFACVFLNMNIFKRVIALWDLYFNYFPEWSSEHTCWSQAICTASWTCDRYPAVLIMLLLQSSASLHHPNM